MGEMRWERRDRRQEKGDRRKETGERRGFSDVISEKCSAYNLAGEFVSFRRTLIANQKYKLVVVAVKSAK